MGCKMKGDFQPKRSAVKALLDQIYDVKFSKHTTLVVVLISMVYTVYRTEHYLATAYHLEWFVAFFASLFIELLVLAAGASMFVALRGLFIAELRERDAPRASVGVWIAGLCLGAAFLALVFVAISDAWLLTHEYVPTAIMSLVQIAQMLFVVGFIVAADLDEREQLRKEHADYADQLTEKEKERQKQEDLELAEKRARAARSCPYCGVEVMPNNRKRHMDSCASKPLTV